ncbi:MAG: hypothetical protein C4297_14190 [Gemmataceae bacterium]
MRFFVVIPAAGRSTRMGRCKLSLPVGNVTLIEKVIEPYRQAGLGPIAVALRRADEDLAPVVHRAGAEVCWLDRDTAHMRQTVEWALDFVQRQWQPSDCDAWFLHPADHPLVSGIALSQLVEATRRFEGQAWVPVTGGQRGHPVLIRWAAIPQLRTFAADLGINAWLRHLGHRVVEVVVSDSGVLVDVDTPADYRRLQQVTRMDT